MFFREHGPPHFHAEYSGHQAVVGIEDLTLLRGRFPPRALGIVIEWASPHQIPAVGPGKVDIDVIWMGSDDGLVHVTRDGGESWKNVTPPDMPDFGRVSLIDASAFDAGKAYVSARLPLLDDFRPHVWRTEDYGETWTRIADGIREDA